MKASDLLLKCLEAQGVKTMYGVPGEENADIMMSLLDSPIEFITTRHEQTAAFMGEMHGRLTGIPGVCLATLGPGATNLTTGVAQANMDNAPLVAIIGQAETTRLHKTSHQNMNSIEMFKPITKWAVSIPSADVIPEVIAKAFKIATSGIPGAVVVELPEDIASHETSAQVIHMHSSIDEEASEVQIDRALALFAQAKKPILLLGDGAVRTVADQPVREFLQKTKCYAAHTFMGKGVVSNLYERSLHCVGLGMKDIAVQAFEESDLILCIGYDMVEWSPAKWNIGLPKKVIHLNSAAAEVDAHYLPEVELVGSIPLIMQELNAKLTHQHVKATAYFEKIQHQAELDIRGDADDARCPMTPKRILKDIREVLRDEDILVSDVGAHKMWIARQYGARQSKTCFISNGFCSMGGSMPGAMEAKRLHPEKNVVAVCGDGGFVMSLQALFTAQAQHIPCVVVVWEDHQYGLIKWKQEMHFKTHSHTELQNCDLAALAQTMGCNGVRIHASEELKPALMAAFKEKRPSVIVVPVDYSENMRLFHHLTTI